MLRQIQQAVAVGNHANAPAALDDVRADVRAACQNVVDDVTRDEQGLIRNLGCRDHRNPAGVYVLAIERGVELEAIAHVVGHARHACSGICRDQGVRPRPRVLSVRYATS